MDTSLVRPVSGGELVSLFETKDLADRVYRTKLAVGSDRAIERVRAAYNLDENFLQSQVEKFTRISDCAAVTDCSLVIHAAHTHWSTDSPIIYRYDRDRNRYLVGLHPISEDEVYYPVSFLRFGGEVYPYEWVDSTVDFPSGFWAGHHEAVIRVLSECLDDSDPIGIGVNFRFRHTDGSVVNNRLTGSTEFPVHVDDAVSQDFSQIVTSSEAAEIDFESRDLVTVSWMCQADQDLKLSPGSLELLRSLRATLSKESSIDERSKILSRIEDELSL